MIEKRVYYKDTDAGGVVYYANYLGFLEIARTEFLRKKGINIEEYAERGILFVVTNVNISYNAPARYGDIIQIETDLSELKRASLVFSHKIFNKKDQHKLISAEIKLCSINKQNKPIPLPKDFANKI